ncbi:hypothetical protein CRYUN_Cryun19dG0073300 [Craigia yunnanensis]
MLRQWRYEVATVKTPVDALSTLRAHQGIDLVVTDLHMPEMNGIELQRQINREFKLPVIIMSSDDKESVMLKSLAGGAVFFIVKPVNPDDLKNVWQYAIATKKGKSVVIEEIGSIEGELSSAGKLSNREIVSVSSVTDEKNNAERGCKRKASRKGKDDKEEKTASAPKKAKVVWTNSLHNQFLEALRHIGLEKAVPKKILEVMNVQGLTRENVASHLQKYRIFLKRVAERSCFSSKALVDRIYKSRFASGHPLLLKTAQEYSRLTEPKQMRGLTFQPGYGGNISTHNAASLGSIHFPNQNASSCNSAQLQHGYGQSRLLGNLANKRLVSGNTNPLYHGNSLGFANGSNLSLNGGLSGGLFNASNGITNGANSSMHTYQQQIQAKPDFYNTGSSSQFRFGSSGLHASNSTVVTGNIGTISTYPTLNSSCTNNNSYTGIRLPTDGQLIGMGQTRLNGGYGSTNGTCVENMNVATMGNQTFCYTAQGRSPSAGLIGINHVSPAYTAANQQANTSRFRGLGNGGASDYNSDHLMNNASFDNITLSQQLGDRGYLSEHLVESNNYKFPNQVQSGDELMNTSVGGGAYPSDESYPTNFNQNTNQASSISTLYHFDTSQQSGGEQLTDSELSSLFQVNNAPASGDDSSDNQACHLLSSFRSLK